ncbi:MAG: FAD:protein FMN transferase [Pseudomonadota bacterium]
MMNRRRFISVSAAMLVAPPAHAAPLRWSGHAMGAEVHLTLHNGTDEDLKAAIAEIASMEKTFSVFDSSSELSQINAAGGGLISDEMSKLLHICDDFHGLTNGFFDPTIQPVFHALMSGETSPWELVGWDRVKLSNDRVKLGRQQALSLNGIAQGFVTDRISSLLRDRGYTKALVSVGEHAAIGGPFRLSLEDPHFGSVGIRTLNDRAIATSSPGAMVVSGETHIFDPEQRIKPRWSTVSVEANTATTADGLSTAFCLMSREEIAEVVDQTGIKATLVDAVGDLEVVG